MNILYDIIGIPFGFLMSLIYNIFGNYAISIIVFTVVTKLLLFPVSYKTQKSSARMQLLSPKLEKLRKSYSNNQQKLNEETQKLYQQEGVNPMGSCMPMFIQMFLLFGVIDVVYKPITHILSITKSVRLAAVEIASGLIGGKGVSPSNLRCELITMEQVGLDPNAFSELPENFLGKVSEFANNFTIFGANLGKTPTLHPDDWTREAVVLALIPFFAGIVQLLSSIYMNAHQRKVNPSAQGNGCVSVMTYALPIWSVWLAFSVPAGIGFYWIWSSLFGFIITFALNQYFTPERIKEINEKEKEKARIYAEKNPGKKSFMQKLMEQQQAALDEQNNANRGNSSGDKISRSEMNRQNRDRINEQRRRMAEKYGDVYEENNKEE